MKFFLLLLLTVFAFSCVAPRSTSYRPFKLVATTALDSLAPIGLAAYKNQLWISDGDNNRVVALHKDGYLEQIYEGIKRPMHLDSDQEYLYVPEYSSDTILLLSKTDTTSALAVDLELDAPAGISVLDDQVAIADFYNHRIVYYNKQWTTLGKKGSAAGEFHYPTDVQLTKKALYIADAYNHRVQVFNHQGIHQHTIGEADSMNAATGLHVSDSLLAVTDFDNNRVLIYTITGQRLQILSATFDKPTDVLFWDEALYVLNYGSGELQRFEQVQQD